MYMHIKGKEVARLRWETVKQEKSNLIGLEVLYINSTRKKRGVWDVDTTEEPLV